MTELTYKLLARLADGNFHSGVRLAREFGVSRATVWSALQNLPTLGLELHAVNGRGYRLAEPLQLHDEAAIRSMLDEAVQDSLRSLVVLPAVDSTSVYLRQEAESGAPSGSVCLAEFQSSGRGRRGRSWQSPFGTNIYLSLLWRFHDGMSRLSGLGLAVAIAVMRSFNHLGATGLGIKWPNDILSDNGKIAGILVDVAGESSGPCYAVIGIGVNYAMHDGSGALIDQPWSRLRDCGVADGRNAVAAEILNSLCEMLPRYQQEGFAPFYAEWPDYDMLRGQEVVVQLAKTSVTGVARGIDENGLLILERDGMFTRYAAGDVSLRRTGA